MGAETQMGFLKVELEKLTFVYRLRGNRVLGLKPLIVLGSNDALPSRFAMWRAEGLAIRKALSMSLKSKY